ncbi:crossover junction endodeoxyribonuclease RuvC [Sphingomonas sp. PvP055]|uniref:endonuclease domain-containing protein n=1 Tax=Sphingomonas sp. PvP055 TaxID=3156391 RepID=UPI0033973700
MGARFKPGRPTAAAKSLRNEATLHEQLLWRQLKGRRLVGLKFTRQMLIAGYIVDFACREHTLAVELDGSQHSDAVAYDAARTSAIERAGYRVLRFRNNDLTSNMTGVLEMIADAALCGERAPTPYPLPQAGGEDLGLADLPTGTADA